MVLTDFLTETRRRWLKAFKLFKRSKSRKSTRNRISPLVRTPTYSGAVDARADIDVNFCACRASLPPPPPPPDTDSNYSSYNSFNSYSNSRVDSFESYGTDSNRSDSAYDSDRSSPNRARVCYATVTYFNVNDSEDSSSILTEYTLLDEEMERDEETTQNMINESLELVSTL